MPYPVRLIAGVTAPVGARRIPAFTNAVSVSQRTQALQGLIDSLTGTYDGYQLALIEQTWLQLYDGSYLSTSDLIALPMFTEHDNLVNWTGGAAAVNHGAAWDIDTGFTTNGSSSWVDYAVNPSLSSIFSQDSMHAGFMVGDASGLTSNDYQIGMTISGTADITIRAMNTSNSTMEWRAQNAGTADSAPVTAALADHDVLMVSRTGSTASAFYKNGVSLQTSSKASTAERNGTIALGRQSTTYKIAKARALFAGAGRTSGQAAAFAAIISNFRERMDESRT